jgi:hypothetical protein
VFSYGAAYAVACRAAAPGRSNLLARQEAVREAAETAVRAARGDECATLTGARVRKNKPPYRGRWRKGP